MRTSSPTEKSCASCRQLAGKWLLGRWGSHIRLRLAWCRSLHGAERERMDTLLLLLLLLLLLMLLLAACGHLLKNFRSACWLFFLRAYMMCVASFAAQQQQAGALRLFFAFSALVMILIRVRPMCRLQQYVTAVHRLVGGQGHPFPLSPVGYTTRDFDVTLILTARYSCVHTRRSQSLCALGRAPGAMPRFFFWLSLCVYVLLSPAAAAAPLPAGER